MDQIFEEDWQVYKAWWAYKWDGSCIRHNVKKGKSHHWRHIICHKCGKNTRNMPITATFSLVNASALNCVSKITNEFSSFARMHITKNMFLFGFISSHFFTAYFARDFYTQGMTSSTNSQNMNTGTILEKSQFELVFIRKEAVKENLQVINLPPSQF